MHHLWLAVQSLSSAQDILEGRVWGAHRSRFLVAKQAGPSVRPCDDTLRPVDHQPAMLAEHLARCRVTPTSGVGVQTEVSSCIPTDSPTAISAAATRAVAHVVAVRRNERAAPPAIVRSGAPDAYVTPDPPAPPRSGAHQQEEPQGPGHRPNTQSDDEVVACLPLYAATCYAWPV